MTHRNNFTRTLPVLLIVLAILAGCQPRSDDTQDIEEPRKAAERGNAQAQFNLGVMYADGRGVPEDYVQAYAWAILSAAAKRDEKAVKGNELLRRRMPPEQVAKAHQLAGELFRRIESSKTK